MCIHRTMDPSAISPIPNLWDVDKCSRAANRCFPWSILLTVDSNTRFSKLLYSYLLVESNCKGECVRLHRFLGIGLLYIVPNTVLLNNQSLNLPEVFINTDALLRVPQPIQKYIHVFFSFIYLRSVNPYKVNQPIRYRTVCCIMHVISYVHKYCHTTVGHETCQKKTT